MLTKPAPARPDLERLIAAAKARGPMTPQELWDQRVSFVYGNVGLENPHITREMVEQIVTEEYGPRPA